MADLDRNTQASQVTAITGGDEAYKADVILERGQNKLVVKSDIELSSSLRIIQDSPQNTRLTNNGAYTTIYESLVPATVSGFMIKFDRVDAKVKLEIDSVEIFDIDCEQLNEFTNLSNDNIPNTYVSWNDTSNVFFFTPNFPIVGDTINISVVGTSNITDYLGSFVQAG